MRRSAPNVPGRDRYAVHHPGPSGRADDGGTHHVAVVGGGIAGLAAATGLAERGVRVTLLEAEAQLGGRVRSWPVSGEGSSSEGSSSEGSSSEGSSSEGSSGDGRTMSRGFHAFFRQYYNLRALLRRIDPQLHRLRAVPDYPLIAPDGARDSFAGLPLTPPLNLMAFVLRSPTFRLRDLARIDARAATEMLAVSFPDTFSAYDGESAAHYLDRLRFPAAARHLALEVFARSFFADPDDFSAGELIAMFHAYFLGSAEGLLFDVPDDDYDTALWRPLGLLLGRLGADVRTGTAVRAIRDDGDGVVLDLPDGELRADAVVVATDLRTTQRLLGAAAAPVADPDWRGRLAALRSAPPFAVWRVWLDRPARPSRPEFVGTAGFGVVDNISIVDRFEDGAGRWASRTGGAVVELHAYALPADHDPAAVRDEMWRVLVDRYPEFAGAGRLAEEWLVRDDCPLVGTEPWRQRLPVTTPDARVVLAGDGVRCDWPVALMERAATTGFLAANELLAGWDLRGHDLWTVPLGPRTRLIGRAVQAAPRPEPVPVPDQPSSPVRTR